MVAGRIHYQLRYSGRRVRRAEGVVGRPRHLIVARVIGEALVVLALAHNKMDDEIGIRKQEGEDEMGN